LKTAYCSYQKLIVIKECPVTFGTFYSILHDELFSIVLKLLLVLFDIVVQLRMKILHYYG
jgi:hypothetical protein